jgi:cytochrome b561
MPLRNTTSTYGSVAKTLHWASALLVLAGWAIGTLGDALPRDGRASALYVHILAGLLVLAVLALRLIWWQVETPPTPEKAPLGTWALKMARLIHKALYVLLLLAPLTGILVQFLRGDPLPIPGVGDVASPWLPNRATARVVKEAHEVLANVLFVTAAIHAAAALFHHWILRDRTLARMLPGHH